MNTLGKKTQSQECLRFYIHIYISIYTVHVSKNKWLIYNIVHPTDVTTKRKEREGTERHQGHTDTLPQLNIQYTSPFFNYWNQDASLSG